MSYLKNIKRSLGNLPGWRTNRHIVVFESDDWGSIRTPSKEVYEICLKQGYQADKNIFSKYDSLASEDDLSLLFDLLASFSDINGNPPAFTANCLVANPDFEKIKRDDFEVYHFELITETFKKYPNHIKCFDLWMKGIETKVFKPQSHGREHLNASRFLHDLKQGNKDARFAFDMQMPGIFAKDDVAMGNNYIVALEYKDEADKISKGDILREGLELFSKLFGYESKSFIATNYVWSPDHEKTLSESNVQYLQGSKYQLIPNGNYSGFKKRYHYLGQKNRWGQLFLTRNGHFEPSLNPGVDWVSSCLADIQSAFFWNKPAIISTHRINYVGFIDQQNRDKSLFLLKELLRQILIKWPDVEFFTSDELGNEIVTR